MTPEAVKPNHGVGLGPAAVGNLTKIGSNVSATAFLYVCRGLTVLVSPLFLIFAIFTLLADMFTLFHFRVTVSLFGVLARLWRRENAQANAVKTANKKVNLQPTPEKLADSSASVVAVPGAAASFPFSPSEIAKAAETGLTVTDAGGICYKEFAIRDSGETAETEPGTDDVAKSEQVRLHVENDDVAAFMEMVGGLGGAKPTHMITLERAADGDVPRLGKCYVLVVANAVNTLRVWVKKAAAEPPRAEPPRAEPLHAEPPHVEPPRVEPELTVEQKQQIGEAGDDHPVRFFDGARYEADANSGGIVPVVDPVNLTSAMRFRSDGDDITHHTLFVEPGDPNENDAARDIINGIAAKSHRVMAFRDIGEPDPSRGRCCKLFVSTVSDPAVEREIVVWLRMGEAVELKPPTIAMSAVLNKTANYRLFSYDFLGYGSGDCHPIFRAVFRKDGESSAATDVVVPMQIAETSAKIDGDGLFQLAKILSNPAGSYWREDGSAGGADLRKFVVSSGSLSCEVIVRPPDVARIAPTVKSSTATLITPWVAPTAIPLQLKDALQARPVRCDVIGSTVIGNPGINVSVVKIKFHDDESDGERDVRMAIDVNATVNVDGATVNKLKYIIDNPGICTGIKFFFDKYGNHVKNDDGVMAWHAYRMYYNSHDSLPKAHLEVLIYGKIRDCVEYPTGKPKKEATVGSICAKWLSQVDGMEPSEMKRYKGFAKVEQIASAMSKYAVKMHGRWHNTRDGKYLKCTVLLAEKGFERDESKYRLAFLKRKKPDDQS